MIKRYLCLDSTTSTKKLTFLIDPHQPPVGHCRTSPIYSVTVNPFEPTSSFYVGLFFCEYAYAEIGRLRKSLNKDFQRYLWFSNGLASIVVVSPDVEAVYDTFRVIEPNVRGYEVWAADAANILTVENSVCLPPAPIDQASLSLADHQILGSDLKWVLREFFYSIQAVVARAAQYAPGQIPIFTKLVAAVNSIIEELVFLHLPSERSSNRHKNVATKFIENEVLRKKHFDFLSSQLVQINSTLSYIISQGYSGIIPIFEHECHIRSFSLLGIGTCYRALSAFARHVEGIFEEHPVAEVIRDTYGLAAAPDPFRQPGICNSAAWDRQKYGIDNHLKSAKAGSDQNQKLVYFSGRQGFRETKFTISAPINSLYAAASVRWSLMTLSHELMHAHVMAIIASLFGDLNEASDDSFAATVKRFDEFRKGHYKGPMNLKDCLAFVILNYCIFDEGINIAHLSGSPTIKLSASTNALKIKAILAAHFGEINEILVHVLDYVYFYNQDDAAYIGLLWESWSPVPVVLEKIEKYILRTLLAVGTKETGDPTSRYHAALQSLWLELLELQRKYADNIIFTHALEVLDKNCSNNSPLLLKFSAGIYLADMAAKFLASTQMHGKLLADKLRSSNEDGSYFYGVEVGQFSPLHIESPVALWDFLVRKALTEPDKVDCDVDSAWAFLACASYKCKTGESYV